MVFSVKLRPRNFFAAETSVAHGRRSEYAVHALKISCNLCFVVGSWCFFTAMPHWGGHAGSTLFLVASLVTVGISLLSAREHLRALRAAPHHCKDERRLSDAEASHKYHTIGEMIEEICYLLGAVSYAIGSVLFEPVLAFDEDALEQGAVLFVLGSAFFVAAAYQNAMALACEGLFTREAHRGAGGFLGRQLIKASLFCTLFGAVLFFAGSFLYQPKLGHCQTGTTPRLAVDQGTLMYVAGSALYLIQSLISLARTIRLHGLEEQRADRSLLTEASRLVLPKPGPFADA